MKPCMKMPTRCVLPDDVGNDKKIQHDVDYTTSVDEQGNVAMEVETSDQEERRHYHR